jgi:hypothetical protein
VRKGPSKNYEILDLLAAGTQVEGYTTSDKQWLRLEGGRFLALAQMEVIDNKSDGGYSPRWIAARSANVRSLPALNAAVSKKLNKDDGLKLIPINSRWGRLEGGGFIFLALLTDQEPKAILHLPAIMRVTAEQATIYTGPGSRFAAVGMFFKNHQVEVTEIQEGWMRIGRDQFMKEGDLSPLSMRAEVKSTRQTQ